MPNNSTPQEQNLADGENDTLDADEAAEVIEDDDDVHMDSDDEQGSEAHSKVRGREEGEGEDMDAETAEIDLINDSDAHFAAHTDSIFCIAQHPQHPEIVVTGSGDDVAYVFDSTPPEKPVLPVTFASDPQHQHEQQLERESLKPLSKLDGHSDSVNAVTFTAPNGEYIVTAGLDGRLRAWKEVRNGARNWQFLAESQEVEEINWLAPCPSPDKPNTIALGASDGSVWVYLLDAEDKASPLTILQAFYLHTESCTAGSWSPDGLLLATVSEDGSFYVWDVFGEAAAAGLSTTTGTSSIVSMTAQNEKFKIEGGLYSVAVAPGGAFAVVGGATGEMRVVGLPRIGKSVSVTKGARGAGANSKSAGGKQAGTSGGASAASMGQAGQILASLHAQQGSIETISFSSPPLNFMATGSVDGSIALFDTAHRFAVRRHIKQAHEEEAVIKVEFVKGTGSVGSLLTSCGNDGVLRRWDTRGGTAAAGQGLLREWKGHRGSGEGGGILDFVQGGGDRVITAGDEYVLVSSDFLTVKANVCVVEYLLFFRPRYHDRFGVFDLCLIKLAHIRGSNRAMAEVSDIRQHTHTLSDVRVLRRKTMRSEA